ncbi:glycoside hydrolase [Hymenobacter profundi]|uniref:Xylanase n=1 Tax=Hymenobacter profundi TaxID=1982110 RepID=A0ABS6WZC8_9BACT|nr:glycoside hydrolase [Hymenobacter profundi]MBW3128582.1 xylanase [Hymenobacter profundi]
MKNNVIWPFRLVPAYCSGAWVAALLLRAATAHGQSSTATTVAIDPAKTYQTIDNFSASDAWSCQFVGQWPEAKKNAMADWLFSTEVGPGGQPKGIGLSMWRFNIGAGSAQQGEQSGIKDEWRRAESFLTSDNTYDWTKQAGQVWFLKAAQQRGVRQFLGFLNSPPVQYTVNGKAYATDAKTNLAPEHYADAATYMAKVVEGVKQTTGITFDYLSPVNEPQWDWSDGGQEGTPFRNAEIAGLTKALNAQLVQQNLPTKILLMEAGKLNYLLATEDKPERGDQINAFFKPSSPTYVGNLPRVASIIAGHSYFTTSPYPQAVAVRQQLADKVAQVQGLRYWQSEYCILGDNAGEINGNKRDLGIGPALYLARTIHNDLVVANAAAWQWWVAISPYDYKDGLIYIDRNKTDGAYHDSKMLWALGNYSRFVRPGAVRVAAQIAQKATPEQQLLVSAYRDAASKQLVVVVVNSSNDAAALNLQLGKKAWLPQRTYTTSATANLVPTPAPRAKQPVRVAPQSITTLIGNLR